MALIIGNASYPAGPLATPANDAGLIAQILRAASFDVVGARDLDEDSMRHAFRDFIDNVSKAGPDTVVIVYFAGYGLQFEGENYLLPIDANIANSDAPVHALRLSDYTHALGALRLKTAIMILDATRASPSSGSGQPLAGGLGWVESEPGMLIAFNATPGTVAPNGRDGYSPYAKALFEMIRQGSLLPAEVFERVRLRVNEVTNGAQVPWDASRIETQFIFFERSLDAPSPAAASERTAALRSQPMSGLNAEDAYMLAILRDTFDGYADFLAAHARDPMARLVRALLAVRREAITWRRSYEGHTPEAFWSYLRRYPHGPHVPDAHRLLAHLAAAIEPPLKFKMIEYDMPTPLPGELEYIERPVLVLDDPIFAFKSLQPSPDYLLAPPPPELTVLEPPLYPDEAHVLPVPVFTPIPDYLSVPTYVVTPLNPVINNVYDSKTKVVAAASTPNSQPDGASGARAAETSFPPLVAPMADLVDKTKAGQPAASPATTGATKPPGQQLLTISPSPPWSTTLDQAVAAPPAATRSTGNMPMPRPRPVGSATLGVPLPVPRPR